MNTNDLEQLAQNAEQASQLLKSMGNSNRLMILCSLLDGEMSVGALNQHVPLSQSALSQHLIDLKKKGLLSSRREAQTIFYRIEGDAPVKIIATLKSIYCPEPQP